MGKKKKKMGEEKKKKLEEEKKKLGEEKKKLGEEKQKEKEKFERITQGTSGRFHEQRHKLETFYDVIVDIDSLKNIKKGWKVKFSKNGKAHYDIMKTKQKLIVGVVGNRNRGKSFILSQLSKETLPDGTSIKTEGLSIKYPRIEESETKEAPYVLIDSAGFENALLETDEFQLGNQDKEKAIAILKDIASDKTLTEYFLQHFIIEKSNILLVVVGILNYPEQKLINRIKTENDKKVGNPPLYIIHNLQTFSLKKQVEDYIKETLMKSATFKLKVKEEVLAGKNVDKNKSAYQFFIEEFFEDNKNKESKHKKNKKQIIHLIMAMHGTEAGDYYNPFVYNFLEKQFLAQNIHETFPIIDDVKEQFVESSQNIMEQPIKLSDFEGNKEEEKENPKNSKEEGEIEIKKSGEEKKENEVEEQKDKDEVNECTNNEEQAKLLEPKIDENNKGKNYLIKLKSSVNENLKFKRCLIDELGFSNFYGKNFEPKFSYNITPVNQKPYLAVQVEIPGESKYHCKANTIDGVLIINVWGKKLINKTDKTDGANPNSYKGNREEGSFNLFIKLDGNIFQLRDKKPDKSLSKSIEGVKYFYFPLQSDDVESGSSSEDEKEK